VQGRLGWRYAGNLMGAESKETELSESRLNPTLRRLLALLRMDRRWSRAEGVYVSDCEGRRFIDGYAQYGVLALGHNAPIVQQAIRSAFVNCEPELIQPFRAPHAEALARELAALAPGMLCRGIFVSTGSEAVEAAIKLVRSRTGRDLILGATGSFHGKTAGALAVTGQRHYAEGFGPSPGGFEFVEFGDLHALSERFAVDGHRIAALFLEPVQGERGVYVAPPGYLAGARALCTKHGAALVLDEIQTGLGRTGRLFACEHDGVAPDVLLLGKALGGGVFPLSGCFTNAQFWDERFALLHSSTFANSNIACGVGREVLRTLAQEGFCAQVASRGVRLLQRLEEMAARYPRVIAAVRGRGLLSAIELRPPTRDDGTILSFLACQGLYSYAVAATMAERGSVLVLPTLGRADVIRFTPPLIISAEQLETALDAMESVFDALQQDPLTTILDVIGALEGYPLAVDREHAGPPPMLTPRLPKGPVKLDYAFLLHYTSLDDVVATNPSLAGIDRGALRRICDYTGAFAPGVVMRAPTIRSATGASVEGIILALPMLPEDMARRGLREVSQEINRAVDLAASLGVPLVGLGGHTAPYSRRGVAACGRGPAITTGNALTAGLAVRGIIETRRAQGLTLTDAEVAVVGARGSVGSLCAQLLARERPRRMVLVGSPGSPVAGLERLAETLRAWVPQVDLRNDVAALADCDVVLTATAAGRPILDAADLSSGTIVCDVARPPDTSAALRLRRDLTVIEGGHVALPDHGVQFGVGNLNDLPAGVTLACLAETILLALDGEHRDVGVGYNVSIAEVDHVLALAARHGFDLFLPAQHPQQTTRHASGACALGAA
jgi:acetylornithine/succinyldiaminopimelate/putrescine aminotransferase/predicted amino acid dehydrogenase